MPATYPTMERLLRGVEPEARIRELTQAEKAQAFLEEQLAKITSKERARRLSMTAFGGADSGIPGGMGAVDFVPFLGSAKGLEEGGRDISQGNYDLESGRYGDALRNYGSAVLGVLPGAAGAVKVAPGLAKAVKGGLGYDQAKIAMQYPDVAPPVLAVDPKTGKEFLQKQLSDEARAVEKVRKAAQKDIDAGKYTPFFNLEERYYADAAKHPLQGRTVTDALPKKQETIDKYRKQYDTPEARKRLNDAFKKGSEDAMAKDWYAMGQLEAEFIKEFGPEVGRNMFKERFADAMAATTGGADPTSNLLMGSYGNYLRQHGITQPKAAYEFPYPIGGRFASGNMAMYDKVINQGAGLQANKTPKRFDFSANFLGHRDRATIDEQMSGGFDPKLMVPPGDSYGVFEAVVHDLAKKQGVEPANFQDVSWAGLKGTKGKPMMQHINEAIERTRRVTGKTPEEVVRDSLVRGTHPLYGVAGTGLTAGALAAAARDQRGDEM